MSHKINRKMLKESGKKMRQMRPVPIVSKGE